MRLYSSCVIQLLIAVAGGPCWKACSAATFKDVTSTIFGQTLDGYLGGFSEYNGDKSADIYGIGSDRQSIFVLLAKQGLSSHSHTFNYLQLNSSISDDDDVNITGIIVADFDGNSFADILILYQNASDEDTSYIYRTNMALNYYHKEGDPTEVFWNDVTLTDHPTILDYNGDLLPDIFGEATNGTQYLWLSNSDTRELEMEEMTLTGDHRHLWTPTSSAYTVLGSDTISDFVLLVNKSGFPYMRIFEYSDGYLIFDRIEHLPTKNDYTDAENIVHYGQLAFQDMDGDGKVDIICPYCSDDICNGSNIAIYVTKKKTWYQLSVPSSLDYYRFLYSKPDQFVLRFGDYNLDGYPDAVTVLYDSSSESNVIVVLRNEKCDTNKDGSWCSTFGRKLIIDTESTIDSDSITNPVVAAFFDFNEDGKPDILATTDEPSQIYAFKNVLDAAKYYVKIQVLSGFCYSDCLNGNLPYNQNQPGASIYYKYKMTSGSYRYGRVGQGSQWSHSALQMPYSIFGLGESANYIDETIIGLPSNQENDDREYTYQYLIPNSENVIIPTPINTPSKWKKQIYVTPDKQEFLLTAITLMGVCFFLSGIIFVFHWLESREDKKEKQEEAKRFHFDAL